MNSQMKLITLLFLAGMTKACVSSKEKDVKLADAPSEDAAFEKALHKASQTRSVIKDFETRYMMTATYLSPEFRAAFAKRLEEVYKKNDVELGEIGQKAGFFISLQIPDDNQSDLTNNQHWTILLKTRDGTLRPILVKPLLDKERWRAFFPSSDFWSHDFLVVFDIASMDANAPKLVEKNPVTVTFANADAQIEFTW